jgi:hypothetical protein
MLVGFRPGQVFVLFCFYKVQACKCHDTLSSAAHIHCPMALKPCRVCDLSPSQALLQESLLL